MIIRHIFPPLLLSVLVAAIAATTQPSSAIAPETGPAAFGQGEFTFNRELISFSFEAHANKTTRARGRAVFDNLSTQTQVVVKIDCLRVDSVEALMTGTVLHSDDPDFPKSADVVFAALDGKGIQSDLMTPLFINIFFPDCNTGASPLTLFEVDGIQIEP